MMASSHSLPLFHIYGVWAEPQSGYSTRAIVDPATEQVSGYVASGASAYIGTRQG